LRIEALQIPQRSEVGGKRISWRRFLDLEIHFFGH
jgi:hypothetical protein